MRYNKSANPYLFIFLCLKHLGPNKRSKSVKKIMDPYEERVSARYRVQSSLENLNLDKL